jgi:hypothetical protein
MTQSGASQALQTLESKMRRRLIAGLFIATVAWPFAPQAQRSGNTASRGSLASKALGKRTFYDMIELELEAAYARAMEAIPRGHALLPGEAPGRLLPPDAAA